MNWRNLYSQFQQGNTIKGITLEHFNDFDTVESPGFLVTESCGDFLFQMYRLDINRRKVTFADDIGLVGVNSLDLSDNCCYLTEGVSDFMSLKLMLKHSKHQNVLGCTTLGGNKTARAILATLFDSYCIVTDNDRTGITNVSNFRQWLISKGKKVTIKLPETGCKDISEQYVKQCRINGSFKDDLVF